MGEGVDVYLGKDRRTTVAKMITGNCNMMVTLRNRFMTLRGRDGVMVCGGHGRGGAAHSSDLEQNMSPLAGLMWQWEEKGRSLDVVSTPFMSVMV